MEIPETKLTAPDTFPFPFTPYSIQKDLMRNLYETLEGKKLGIFESPTGTGKSMSLICGSLKWLLDAEKRIKQDVESKIEELNEELKKVSLGSNWLEDHAVQAKSKLTRDRYQDFLNGIVEMENRIEEIKIKAKKINVKISEQKKFQARKLEKNQNNKNKANDGVDNTVNDVSNNTEDIDDNDVLLDDVVSIDGNSIADEKSSESEMEEEKKEKYNGIKVYLCSRTHSQLSQLVREIEKSPYKDLKVRVVSLASRQNYCINESVVSLKHLPMINERCQNLHNNKNGKTTKKSKNGESLKRRKTIAGCPYYDRTNIENLKLKVLTEIQDVEHLVQWGKELNGCPYYASRRAIDDAQVIVVPYNTILHKSTRIACGIDLKDSVVIIDEAHNLLDTIGSIHSCLVTGQELAASYSQLTQYKDKYSERLSPLNLLHLNQLIFIVKRLWKKVGGKGGAHPNTPTEQKTGVTIETLAEFVMSCEIDSINFYRVLEFIIKSNIVNKLRGFIDRYKPSVVIRKKEEKGVSAFLKSLATKKELEQENDQVDENDSVNGNSLLNVVSFIRSLTSHCLDGRIVCSLGKTMSSSFLKFLLLNPASHFSDIIKEARSVVLAGGTMQPFSEFTDQLFHLAGGTPDRISIFTCGHIIPENNILPIILSTGPSGKTLDFSYQQRNSTELLDELGRLLVNVCNVVPAGIVCFFPSYDYENFVFRHLEKTNIINKLQNKKRVLREPKKSNKVDEVLGQYSTAIKQQGALLFSVVGGKLSEGLNFNDDLGRCVIVVGLPYPNLTSPELKEKMNYLDTAVGSGAGKVYYENLCMKAVNQSVGRSVRHKDDYASVLLIDQRYARPKNIKALPEWIRKSLRNEPKFGPVIGLLAKFFASKKK